MKIWRIRIACWITNATNTHSECVVLIVFPLQQWLHVLAGMLGYTYCNQTFWYICLLGLLTSVTNGS